MPEKWGEPYSKAGNWPYCLQVAWIIYTRDAQRIKTEDHYIREDDMEISPAAIKVHGITSAFLDQHGESRTAVMQLLADDLIRYQPLVLGHFMELDYHMLAADFYRAGIENPVENLPTFCTMLATTRYVRDPRLTYLRLGELYSFLFNAPQENPHNALADAEATADCFFELCRRGDIDDEKIARQQTEQVKGSAGTKKQGCGASVLLILSILVCFLLYML